MKFNIVSDISSILPFSKIDLQKIKMTMCLWNAVTVLCGQLDCDHGHL